MCRLYFRLVPRWDDPGPDSCHDFCCIVGFVCCSILSAARIFALRDLRIAIRLLFLSRQRLARQDFKIPCLAPSRNASLAIRSSREWKLITTSLPPGFKSLGACSSSACYLVQLVIHTNSKSLKGPGRRMNIMPLGFHCWGRSRYNSGQFRRRCNRPRPDNGSGDSPRPPFLSEFVNQVGEILFVSLIYHLFGGYPDARIHPHIQGSIRLKTKSSVRLVQLHRTDAEIREQPINACRLELVRRLSRTPRQSAPASGISAPSSSAQPGQARLGDLPSLPDPGQRRSACHFRPATAQSALE